MVERFFYLFTKSVCKLIFRSSNFIGIWGHFRNSNDPMLWVELYRQLPKIMDEVQQFFSVLLGPLRNQQFSLKKMVSRYFACSAQLPTSHFLFLLEVLIKRPNGVMPPFLKMHIAALRAFYDPFMFLAVFIILCLVPLLRKLQGACFAKSLIRPTKFIIDSHQ